MSHSDPLMMAALSKCATAAKTRGHTMGRWQKVTEEMHVSMCLVCAKLTLVTKSSVEKRWSIGGSVLKQECLEQHPLRETSLD